MMRRIVSHISVFVLLLLMVSCQHKELCYHHAHTARVNMDVDWSLFNEEVPTGMSVYVYPTHDADPVEHLTNNISLASMDLKAAEYNALVFNQSTTEFGTLGFRGMESYQTAQVYTTATKSNWYETKAEEEKLASEPEWIATATEESLLVTEEMVNQTAEYYKNGGRSRSVPEYHIASFQPRNIIYTINVRVNIDGVYNLRSARASLNGLAEGYVFSERRTNDTRVTQLIENWSMEIDKNDPTKGSIIAKITCFGLPHDHQARPEENELSLSLLLVDNQTILTFPFLVGDKFVDKSVESDVHLTLALDLEFDLGTRLPDVLPEDGSEGGFKVDVDEWGDEKEIEIII